MSATATLTATDSLRAKLIGRLSSTLGNRAYADSWIKTSRACISRFARHDIDVEMTKLAHLGCAYASCLEHQAQRNGIDLNRDELATVSAADRVIVRLPDGEIVPTRRLARAIRMWLDIRYSEAKLWSILISLALPVFPGLLPSVSAELTEDGCILRSTRNELSTTTAA